VDRDVVDERAEFHAIKWIDRVKDYVNQILEDKLPPEFVSTGWKRLVHKVSGISPREEMRGE
jgi:hypothetical protein